MKSVFGSALILTMLAILIIGCGSDQKSESNASKDDGQPYDSLVITVEGRDGMSVFDLTEEEHTIDYIESTIGNFVKAIDSVEINNDFSWIYSVNDSLGRIASDRYITSDSDIVKWHYRKQ